METKKNSSGSAAKYGVVITNKPNDLSPYRREVLLNCDPAEGLTEQAHAEDCDINNIVKRHSVADLQFAASASSPLYGDFSAANDYKEALDTVMRAEEQFAGLPSSLRARMDNDPSRFLEFVSDEKNAEELVSLGLAVKHGPSDAQELKTAIRGLTEAVQAPKSSDSKK